METFPNQIAALNMLPTYTIVQRHDDGDLTIKSGADLFVVTTDGKVFRQLSGKEVQGITPRDRLSEIQLADKKAMEEASRMSKPRTEEERLSFHERIFGKGSSPPLERLGRGQTVNNLLPMSPDSGPPLPRGLGLKWPWKR